MDGKDKVQSGPRRSLRLMSKTPCKAPSALGSALHNEKSRSVQSRSNRRSVEAGCSGTAVAPRQSSKRVLVGAFNEVFASTPMEEEDCSTRYGDKAGGLISDTMLHEIAHEEVGVPAPSKKGGCSARNGDGVSGITGCVKKRQKRSGQVPHEVRSPKPSKKGSCSARNGDGVSGITGCVKKRQKRSGQVPQEVCSPKPSKKGISGARNVDGVDDVTANTQKWPEGCEQVLSEVNALERSVNFDVEDVFPVETAHNQVCPPAPIKEGVTTRHGLTHSGVFAEQASPNFSTLFFSMILCFLTFYIITAYLMTRILI